MYGHQPYQLIMNKIRDAAIICLVSMLLISCYSKRITLCRNHSNIQRIQLYSYPLEAEFVGSPLPNDAKLSNWSYKDTIENLDRIQEICDVISHLPYKQKSDESLISWRGSLDIIYSNGEKENLGIDSEGKLYFHDSFHLLNLLGIVCIPVK